MVQNRAKMDFEEFYLDVVCTLIKDSFLYDLDCCIRRKIEGRNRGVKQLGLHGGYCLKGYVIPG